MNKRLTLAVLDFDGTVTDAEQEGKPYVAGYTEDLCLLTGKKADEVIPVLQNAEAEIAADPGNNGWLYNGIIVAPATVDPYLRMREIARRVFNHFGAFSNQSDRDRLLDFLYTNNYSLSGVAFKEGAEQMLRDLSNVPSLELRIITNSHTEGVCNKIRTLDVGGSIFVQNLCRLVIGNAKKYAIDNRLQAVAESMSLPGLSRPVYLRRLKYFEVLEDVCQTHNIKWEDVTVVGDIFELDLALPFALGARIGLVVNQFTPQYEMDFIKANPGRATLIHSLSEVVPFVKG